MDFTLIKKEEAGIYCYKLLRSNFCSGYYVIIVQGKDDFYCGSFKASKSEANSLFYEIVSSETAPETLGDILTDISRKEALKS